MTNEAIKEKEEIKNQEPSKYKLVHVNMSENTLSKIDEIKFRLHADNKTSAIRYSIDIADMITQAISRGGEVILKENGNTYILKIPGIS